MSHPHDDYATEPIPGLPEHLPQGERILWQGRPDWRALAKRAFHVRLLAVYAIIAIVWRAVTVVYDGGAVWEALVSVGILVGVCGAGLAVLAGLAYVSARGTVYTVTSKRLVMRFGIALQLTVQIPFSKIGAANLKRYGDGTGDIPVTVSGKRVSYAVMWPHVRPWHLLRPEPMLRCVTDPEKVADLLATALSTAAHPADPLGQDFVPRPANTAMERESQSDGGSMPLTAAAG